MNMNSELLDNVTEISRQRTTVNAASNYVTYAVAAVIGIFLQAYIIRALGKNEYAIWPLVGTCMSFAGLIPIGIGSGAGRFLAYALGKKNLKEVGQITTSLFVALVVVSVFYTVAIIFLSIYFEKIFDIPEGAEGIGPWAMLLAGLSGAVALPFGVFQGGLRAAQKFVILNVIRIISIVTRLILVILAFTLSLPSLIWIAGIQLLLAMGEGIVILLVAKKVVPWQKVRWSLFSWKVLKRVSNYSLLVLITTIAGLLYWKTDNIIINKLLDPCMLTGYAVVVNLVLSSYRMTSLGAGALGPVATIMFSQGNLPRIGRLIFRANRITVSLSVPLLLFLIIYGKEVIEVYVGKQYSDYSYLFLLLAGASILSVTQANASIVPHALNKMGLVSLVSLGTAVANILLSMYFVISLKWGLMGIAAGTAIVTAISRTIWSPWYTSHLLKIPWRRYFWNANIKPLVNCIPVLCVMLIFYNIKFSNTLTHLIVSFTVCGVVHLLIAILCGIAREDRKKVFEMLRRVRYRISNLGRNSNTANLGSRGTRC